MPATNEHPAEPLPRLGKFIDFIDSIPAIVSKLPALEQAVIYGTTVLGLTQSPVFGAATAVTVIAPKILQTGMQTIETLIDPVDYQDNFLCDKEDNPYDIERDREGRILDKGRIWAAKIGLFALCTAGIMAISDKTKSHDQDKAPAKPAHGWDIAFPRG